MGLFGAIFAIPIFAQSLLGYTAQQTGMLILPGALASAVMMPIAGKLSGKYDSRVLIAIGALVVVGSLMALGSLSPQTGSDNMFWPLIWRGAGTVLMFLPLSLATLSPVPKKDLPSASGFYNLTRQLGGSIGIAVLTTLLSQRQAVHYHQLSERISAYNPIAVNQIQTIAGGLSARGIDPDQAQRQALQIMNRSTQLQSAVMSFNDIFRIVAIIFLLSLPLLFLLGKGRGGGPAPAAEH
jgi:DHA2 family multidrug resistance protein